MRTIRSLAVPDSTVISLAVTDICGTQPSACDGTLQGGVLYLASLGLTGTVPPELGLLTDLETIYLGENHNLSGTLPPQLGKLSKLTGIDIDDNKISGTIPLALGELVNLESLSLDNAKLSGTVPPELGKLSSLDSLLLYNNALSGSLPSSVSGLGLTRCRLGGTNRYLCPLPTLRRACGVDSDYPPLCSNGPHPPSPP